MLKVIVNVRQLLFGNICYIKLVNKKNKEVKLSPQRQSEMRNQYLDQDMEY